MRVSGPSEAKSRLESAFSFAQAQVRRLVTEQPEVFPVYTRQGRWVVPDSPVASPGGLAMDWSPACLPGMMWIFFEATQDQYWRETAKHYSFLAAEKLARDGFGHDAAFGMFHGSHRRWWETSQYEGTPEPMVRDALLAAGRTLGGRLQETGGYLPCPGAEETLAIDSMMSVPSVLYTGVESEDHDLIEVGSRHCATVRRFLVRGDGSTCEEATFDTNDGACLRTRSYRGWRADSCWSRGLACAIHGFATCGRLVGFGPWLETARHCAYFLIEKLSQDPVPPWDFDAGEPGFVLNPEPQDTSAAAIAAAGLLELADAEVRVGPAEARQRQYFQDAAIHILEGLCDSAYLAEEDEGWAGVLKEATVDRPRQIAVGESVIWGDFFFVDALHRAIRHLRSFKR